MEILCQSADLIQSCSFAEIQKVWAAELWPQRESPIDPVSCIQIDGQIDMQIRKLTAKTPPRFWKIDSLGSEGRPQTIAVISSQMTTEKLLRLRGVWVHAQGRGLGLGRKLFSRIHQDALELSAEKIWTMARETSLPFYEALGFQKIQKITGYEFGPHWLAEYPMASSQSK